MTCLSHDCLNGITGFGYLGVSQSWVHQKHQARLPQPLRGLLKQAFVAGKAKKLLGETGAREGPQTCTGATTQNDRRDLDHDRK